MASRLYIRETTASFAPTAGDKSAVLPVGTDGGDFNQSLALDHETLSTAQTDYTFSTAAITTQQSAMLARHTSPKLRAQTIAANTWTLLFDANESNADANAFLAVSFYVWRPSTSAVVGFIRDSTATLGVEFAGVSQTVTFAGSAVTAAAQDVLVLEAWYVATAGKANTRTITWSVGLVGTATYTYIETPQDLSWFTFNQFLLV